ncbi:hypothetical protein V8C86DRAFT_2711125 [Haematococcus lacustris]
MSDRDSPPRVKDDDEPPRDRSASKRDRSISPVKDRSPVRSRSRSPRKERSRSPVRRDRDRVRDRSRSRERRRSPSPVRRPRSRSRSRSRDRYPSRRSRSPPPRRRSRSRSRSPGGRAFYGLPNRREPPRVGLQMFVAGFNFLSTERDVERRFGRYGNVTEVRIVRDPTGKSRGFGFVAMDNEEDVRECIRNMNGRDWEGRRLQVELCRHPK